MHDNEGLFADLKQLGINRRRALGLLAMGGATLAGCHRGPPGFGADANAAIAKSRGADGAQCVSYSQETNGPFPADGTNRSSGSISNALQAKDIVRRDIRPDLGSGGKQALGVPLTVDFSLVDVRKGCAPLAGHAIYIWHCDAGGNYSLYDKPERSYLRGLQVSDANGRLQFETIVPGCYDGRFPHFHIEIFPTQDAAKTGSDAILTSQIAIPADVCAAAYHANAAYTASIRNFSGNDILANDFIFSDGGKDQMAAMTLRCNGSAAAGYRGVTTVGI